MESNSNKSISIEIPNYSGPLEVLLNLAKTQKVDLTKISITKLANQFLEYIKDASNFNLELSSANSELIIASSFLISYFSFFCFIVVFFSES